MKTAYKDAMNPTDHVLIVDDDAEIRHLLAGYLSKYEFRTSTAADGLGMWAALEQAQPDLIVLDLMLPGDDGLVLCRDLRARWDTPIIMLTARGEDTDRIVGLEMGADDYLAKPFNPRELLARIKVILRRTRSQPRGMPAEKAQRIRFAGWCLDTAARHLLTPDGLAIPLSGAEYRLLIVFLSHPNRVLNRDQLMDLCLGREGTPFDRSIDVQVSRLRQRLGEDAREPVIIKTVRGEGYVLAARVEQET